MSGKRSSHTAGVSIVDLFAFVATLDEAHRQAIRDRGERFLHSVRGLPEEELELVLEAVRRAAQP